MTERVVKSDTIHVNVNAGQRVVKTDVIHVIVGRQYVTKMTTIHVNVGTLTVSAGSNVTVEAGGAFTLTAVENLNGTTVASRAWKLGTTTVGTAKAAALTAPITLHGTTLTYTYSATTSGSQTATSSVVVTVLPATRRVKVGGVIYPSIRRAKVGP